MNWLIAEDEADIRNLVATMAQVWGHQTLIFESGGKAWEFLDAVEAGSNNKPLPEFALMDIRMPGKRGDEVAKRIRTVAPLKHIPVVLMTAFVMSDDEREDMIEYSGVDMIINKPLPNFNDLKTLLEGIIAKKQAENGA